MTTDKIDTTPEAVESLAVVLEGNGCALSADLIRELSRENAELRNDIRVMVEKAAAKSLDGYRELGQRAAHAESERDTLRAQVAALQGAVERKDYALVNVRASLDPYKNAIAVEQISDAIAYTGQPLAPTDPNETTG